MPIILNIYSAHELATFLIKNLKKILPKKISRWLFSRVQFSRINRSVFIKYILQKSFTHHYSLLFIPSFSHFMREIWVSSSLSYISRGVCICSRRGKILPWTSSFFSLAWSEKLCNNLGIPRIARETDTKTLLVHFFSYSIHTSRS